MGWIYTPRVKEGKQNAKSSAAELKDIHFDQIV